MPNVTDAQIYNRSEIVHEIADTHDLPPSGVRLYLDALIEIGSVGFGSGSVTFAGNDGAVAVAVESS